MGHIIGMNVRTIKSDLTVGLVDAWSDFICQGVVNELKVVVKV